MDTLQAKCDALESLIKWRISESFKSNRAEEIDSQILELSGQIKNYKIDVDITGQIICHVTKT